VDKYCQQRGARHDPPGAHTDDPENPVNGRVEQACVGDDPEEQDRKFEGLNSRGAIRRR